MIFLYTRDRPCSLWGTSRRRRNR